MRGKRAKKILKEVSSFIKPQNVGKYKVYKNRRSWQPAKNPETGEIMRGPDGEPLLQMVMVEGTYVTANPRREMYQAAKKAHRDGHRDGMHDYQRTHSNHRRTKHV